MAWMVVCFFTQTALVYLDPSNNTALSDTARQGRRIWNRNNCQSCHQLYGFGGFLGPDLTNAAERVPPERLRHLLTEGSGRMPAFGFSQRQITAVGEFLEAMHETGRGQARMVSAQTDSDWGRRLLASIRTELDASPDAQVSDGFQLFISRGCQGCHAPFGPVRADVPDLVGVFDRLTEPEIRQVLEVGRLPRMPRPNLDSDDERERIFAFLSWLDGHRKSLPERAPVSEEPRFNVSELPWWEFP